MSSRKAQREEARARRLAEEQARADQARRQRNIRMLAGVLVGAVAVVAVAIAISSGGSSGATGLAKGADAAKTVQTVQQLLTGIPQSQAQLGNPKAPVTMYYYGDLQCPICKDFTLSSFPELVTKDVRQGRVRVIYRGLRTATPDSQTFQTEQVAALAAGKQNRFWDFAELFYREQGTENSGYVNESYLNSLARQTPGLTLSQWQSARSDTTLASQVHSEEQTGTSAGVTGTPTLIFQGPKGKATASQGVPSYSQLEKSIQSVA
jgi:protein-disulfide isomerase